MLQARIPPGFSCLETKITLASTYPLTPLLHFAHIISCSCDSGFLIRQQGVLHMYCQNIGPSLELVCMEQIDEGRHYTAARVGLAYVCGEVR